LNATSWGALAVAFALAPVSMALADPCKAIPDKGPMPAHLKPGSTFSGPVSYVGDGDSLCVALGPSPADWVEVRIADFYAPELHEPGGQEAKAALEWIARGRRVECVAQHRSYDRVVAVCRLQGVSLGYRMRRAGGGKGGLGQ
jgi:micrococcal nuclease